MKRTRILLVVVGMFIAVVLLSSCDGSQAPTTQQEVPRMTITELKERLDNGDAIVIGDIRAKTAYDFKRLPGAVSIPENQVEAHVQGIPLDQEIILYCD